MLRVFRQVAPLVGRSHARLLGVSRFSSFNYLFPSYKSDFSEDSLPYKTWWNEGVAISDSSVSDDDKVKYLIQSMDLQINHQFIIDADHITATLGELVKDPSFFRKTGHIELVFACLNRFTNIRSDLKKAIFNEACDHAKLAVGSMQTASIVATLEELAALQVAPGQSFHSPRMNVTLFETIGRRCVTATTAGAGSRFDLDASAIKPPTADEVCRLLKVHSKAQIHSDHIDSVLNYATRILLPESMTDEEVVATLYAAIATRQFSQEFIQAFTAKAASVNLAKLAADMKQAQFDSGSGTAFSGGDAFASSEILRHLKFIEMTIRLELPQTYRSLSQSVLEGFSLVRNITYVDPSITKATPCSAQLKIILESFGMKAKPAVVGPFGLRLADETRRIAVESIEAFDHYPQSSKLKFWTAAKFRLLELLGWRVITFSAKEWKALERTALEDSDHTGRSAYHRKLDLVRNRLVAENIVENIPSIQELEAAQSAAAMAIARRVQVQGLKVDAMAKTAAETANSGKGTKGK